MKTLYETAYAPDKDLTFIMKCTYAGDNLTEMECIGFYHGEPNSMDTAYFTKYASLKATYAQEI